MSWATKRELRALRRAWRYLVAKEARLGGEPFSSLAAGVHVTRLRLEEDLRRLSGEEGAR